MLVECSLGTLRSDPRPWGCPRAPLRKAQKPPFCACTLEAFPRAAAPENLHTAVCGPLLGLPIFPAFVGGPGTGGGRGTSRPGQGFVLRTTRGRSALLQGGGAGTGCLGGVTASQHAPTCLWSALCARSGATPAPGDAPVLPCARPRNLHFALARWRPSRGLLRLRICTQPSVVPFWASLFSQHLLAAQARAAVEARLGPDRASFCVPQGAGQPSCKAVELAQAAWEA